MKHFKNLNASGFTFIEVMFAVMMVGTLLSAVFTLQNTSFNSIVSFSNRLRRVFMLRNWLGENRIVKAKGKKEATSKKIDDPETKMSIKTEIISKKSSLNNIKNVMVQNISAEWQGGIQKQKESLVSLFFKPPEKKKK